MEIRHTLSTNQFTLANLESLFTLAQRIRKLNSTRDGQAFLRQTLPHKRAMLFFTQPSTRTFLSFQSACNVLGMHTSEIRDPSTSSEKKGESIEDSIRTFSSYVDLIVMRSPIPGLCDIIADMLDNTPRPVPIINAGSGPDEHPTQALLDIYTLYRCFSHSGGINGKKICMVGDLKRGRTVRSLSKLLTHYPDVELIFCSPEDFQITNDLRTFLQDKNMKFSETTEFEDSICKADAIYMTRIQDEYDIGHNNSDKIDTSAFSLKKDHLTILKPECRILHPMPRRNELDIKIDDDPRAVYWEQQRNGMWIRAALVAQILGVDEQIFFTHGAESTKTAIQ